MFLSNYLPIHRYISYTNINIFAKIVLIMQLVRPTRSRSHSHQDAQEGQHLRLLLPLRHPAVQGGLWHHGRRQGRPPLSLRPHRKHPLT